MKEAEGSENAVFYILYFAFLYFAWQGQDQNYCKLMCLFLPFSHFTNMIYKKAG